MATLNVELEFSRLRDVCYLDHAGTALYSDSQIDAVCEYLKTNLLGNPHSLNLSSRYCHDAVDQIRYRILNHFNTNEDEYTVVFTSGTTSALKSVVEWFDWGQTNESQCEGQFVYLRDTHTSVLGLREIAAECNSRIHCLEHEDAFTRFQNAMPHNRETQENGYLCNALFVYPAMCNFSGCKYPLTWIEKLRTTRVLDNFLADNCHEDRSYRWFSLLDAATYVSTNKLDLSEVCADFVVFSFYKMFGYPTGLGALLIRKRCESVLMKSYFGGGSILMAMSNKRKHVKRPILHEWYEDGTINFLSIISVRQGFDTLERLCGNIENISQKVFNLTKYLHGKLMKLHHSNKQRVVKIYRDTDYCDPNTQGGIINFNLMRNNGAYVGYLEVLHVANSYGIHLRTGCFCNPGACQRHLQLTNDQWLSNYTKGHTCADNIDLIDGYPTGSVRISFGYTSSESDADYLIKMITECFVMGDVIVKEPRGWQEECQKLRKKFYAVENIETISEITRLPPQKVGRLTKIFVYPIKSCGALSVSRSWPLTKTGLQYDREWMVVSEDGVVLTQKQLPHMCQISPNIDLKKGIMSLHFFHDQEKRTFSLPLEHKLSSFKTISIHQSKVCNDRVEIVDCGNEVADWLALQLDKSGIRLVKLLARSKKECVSTRDLSLANQAQYLLISQPSIRWLQTQISLNPNFEDENLDRRFRSNFVIDGDFEALEEFKWNSIHLGSFQFHVEGPCTRCQMICINQTSGERNREPLTALSRSLKGRIQFGIYLRNHNVDASSTLNINDEVLI